MTLSLRPMLGLAATALFSAGLVMPAIAAKPMATASHRQMTEFAGKAPLVTAPETALEKDIQQLTAQLLAEEMSQWSQSEQAQVKAVLALNLDANELQALVALPESELKAQLKHHKGSNEALIKIGQIAGADETSVKGLPALLVRSLLATYMGDIARAFVMGNLRGALLSADLDVPALIGTLVRGDRTGFTRQMTEAFPKQETFVNAISTGADFACNTATYDFNRRNCNRFSNFVRNLLANRRR